MQEKNRETNQKNAQKDPSEQKNQKNDRKEAFLCKQARTKVRACLLRGKTPAAEQDLPDWPPETALHMADRIRTGR